MASQKLNTSNNKDENMYLNSKSSENFYLSIILLASVTFYIYFSSLVIINSNTWVDEVIYLIKSWKYVSGEVAPYTSNDPTWYMPFYFFQLGVWQHLFGQDITTSRLLSSIIGLMNGLLIFRIIFLVTGNKISSAYGVLFFFTVPSVIFYFNTAIPNSSVSLILLISIVTIIENMGVINKYKPFLLGILFSIILLYRQNMILALVCLIPIYLLTIDNKIKHFSIILLTILFSFLIAIYLLPEKFIFSLLRLPIISPYLSQLGVFTDSQRIVDSLTFNNNNLSFDRNKLSINDLIDGFFLPYLGIVICCLTVIILSRKKRLVILTLTPLLFFFLSITHYIGSFSYCGTCILPYTTYFVSIGAICGGFSISLISLKLKTNNNLYYLFKPLFILLILTTNIYSTAFALREEYKFYPASMMTNTRKTEWQKDTVKLAQFIKNNTKEELTVLPIHNLSMVPYSIFLAQKDFPQQMININHTYRKIKNIPHNKGVLLQAIEKEGLWSDSLLNEWIEKKYNIIVYQSDPRRQDKALIKKIEKDFSIKATYGFRGWNIYIYKRNKA